MPVILATATGSQAGGVALLSLIISNAYIAWSANTPLCSCRADSSALPTSISPREAPGHVCLGVRKVFGANTAIVSRDKALPKHHWWAAVTADSQPRNALFLASQ